MHGPEYLIFQAGSWWGKPGEEFLVSLVQIWLWFSKVKQMKHLELGGEKKAIPKLRAACNKNTTPVV